MSSVLFPVSGVETWPWLPPLAALVITFCTSMVGISGAFLLVPFQLSVLGFASPAASATNLVFNLIAIPGGMYRYWKEERLFWPLALAITVGGAPGTLVGAWLRTHWLVERAVFESFVAIVLLYLAWRMLTDLRRAATTATAHEPLRLLGWRGREMRLAQGAHEYRVALPPLLGFSFLIAVVGTAYGIGGGSLMVPLLLTFYGLPMHAIAGATLTASFLTSGLALALYSVLPVPLGIAVRPDWWLGLAFGIGGLLGAYLGARMQRRIPRQWLSGFLALLLLGLALGYLWPGRPAP